MVPKHQQGQLPFRLLDQAPCVTQRQILAGHPIDLEDQVAFLQSPGAGSQARLRDVLDEDLTAKFDSKLWGGGKLRQGLGTGSPAHLGAQPLGHNPTGSQASSLHVTLGLSRHEQPM